MHRSRVITYSNDFREGSDGDNPAVGLGVLDVARVASALKGLYGH